MEGRMSTLSDPLAEKIEETIDRMLAVEPATYEKVYGNGGMQGDIEHRLTFAAYVTRDQVEAYLKTKKYFGYDPCGYGGVLKPHGQQAGQHWTWEHSRTTGD
jgi:hypothetical protein